MSGAPSGGPVERIDVVELGAHDLDRVVELCGAALPDESLTRDDLEAVALPETTPAPGGSSGRSPLVRRDEVVVWGVQHGGALVGAAVGSLSDAGGWRSAHLQLLVVHPARRRRGLGSQLVAEFERWACSRDVAELAVGAGAPFYLFTGVDSRWTDALCCFEALGYRRAETELDLVCATTPGAAGSTRPTSASLQLHHVADDDAAVALVEWVQQRFPQWQAEFERAAQQGTVVVAHDERGSVVGAAAHSVSRTGVVGPVAVDPDHQLGGVGARLVREVLVELSAAGLRQAEIAWTSTVRFYARACGARVGRSSIVLRKATGSER